MCLVSRSDDTSFDIVSAQVVGSVFGTKRLFNTMGKIDPRQTILTLRYTNRTKYVFVIIYRSGL